MPKSKEYISSESDDESGSDYEPKKKKVKTEAKKPEPKKPEPKKEESKKDGISVGPNGETMFQLSRMRFATVSEFRGKALVSIREYYDKDGELRPGKKGISLSIEQWSSLKDHIDEIDKAVKKC